MIREQTRGLPRQRQKSLDLRIERLHRLGLELRFGRFLGRLPLAHRLLGFEMDAV
jgi:hypothetical protein